MQCRCSELDNERGDDGDGGTWNGAVWSNVNDVRRMLQDTVLAGHYENINGQPTLAAASFVTLTVKS